MYTVDFWGGPRDGDTAYQTALPPDKYFMPFDSTPELAEIVGTPVERSESEQKPVESHSYAFKWISDKHGVFYYTGVIPGPGSSSGLD